MELQPGGATGASFVRERLDCGFGATHVALSVATDADTVEGVVRRKGWFFKVPAVPI